MLRNNGIATHLVHFEHAIEKCFCVEIS
jgi:hypothetical protein